MNVDYKIKIDSPLLLYRSQTRVSPRIWILSTKGFISTASLYISFVKNEFQLKGDFPEFFRSGKMK
ncbi:MAG: hypothetical protein R3A12_14650 [Ignavibacteria bacterium]